MKEFMRQNTKSISYNCNKNRRMMHKKLALLFLGIICKQCGSNNKLEFDHINSESKSFRITNNLTRKWESLQKELEKCQLLCKQCHIDKSLEERGLSRVGHGALSMYTNHKCRCELCRKANAEWARNHKAKLCLGGD